MSAPAPCAFPHMAASYTAQAVSFVPHQQAFAPPLAMYSGGARVSQLCPYSQPAIREHDWSFKAIIDELKSHFPPGHPIHAMGSLKPRQSAWQPMLQRSAPDIGQPPRPGADVGLHMYADEMAKPYTEEEMAQAWRMVQDLRKREAERFPLDNTVCMDDVQPDLTGEYSRSPTAKVLELPASLFAAANPAADRAAPQKPRRGRPKGSKNKPKCGGGAKTRPSWTAILERTIARPFRPPRRMHT